MKFHEKMEINNKGGKGELTGLSQATQDKSKDVQLTSERSANCFPISSSVGDNDDDVKIEVIH